MAVFTPERIAKIFSVDTFVHILELNQIIRNIGENKNEDNHFVNIANDNPNDSLTTLDLTNLLDDFNLYLWNLYPEF